MDLLILQNLGVALAIGALIGLEREHSTVAPVPVPGREPAEAPSRHAPLPSLELAGIRTFPLIALCGAVSAYLTVWLGPLVLVAAFGAFGLLVAVAYHHTVAQSADLGLTTEVSALIVFALGALCLFAPLELCGAIGVAVYLLLALKRPLHGLARNIELEDIYAIGKFGAVTLLVLPLLPDEAYGPFGVLNPRKIWMLVILIAAISLAGYVAVKALGPHRGFGLTGLLGGLVSSTAVTLAFSRHSKTTPALALPCALAIVLACTTMLPRVLAVSSLLNRELLLRLWMPLGAMTLVGLAACAVLYHRSRRTAVNEAEPRFSNPFELGPAVKFALLFALVLLGSRALAHYLGTAGLYLSGVVAGLTDVDAITLSMAKLSHDGAIPLEPAITTITLATMANTLTKAGIALSLAGPDTRRWVSGTLVAQALVGGAVIALLGLF
jgi:uncharacterized membrane protein (DUF4010 family)